MKTLLGAWSVIAPSMTQLAFYGVIFLTVVEMAQRLPEAASAGLQPAVATTVAPKGVVWLVVIANFEGGAASYRHHIQFATRLRN